MAYRVVLATPSPQAVGEVMGVKVKVAPRYIQSLAERADMLAIDHCQGILRAGNIEESLMEAAYVIVAMDESLKVVHGFTTLQVEEDSLQITVLCAKKLTPETRIGTHLLNLVTALAQKLRKPKLRLDAVEEAIEFYKSRGFVETGSCNEGECLMERAVSLPPTQGMGRLRLKTLRKSHKKEKKWDAVFEKPDGSTKIVPFGQKGYSDYTKHKDKTRRQRYIDRHSGMGENWRDPATPGALSRYILWNKPTLQGSLRDFKKRFGV